MPGWEAVVLPWRLQHVHRKNACLISLFERQPRPSFVHASTLGLPFFKCLEGTSTIGSKTTLIKLKGAVIVPVLKIYA